MWAAKRCKEYGRKLPEFGERQTHRHNRLTKPYVGPRVVFVAQSCPTLCHRGCNPPGSSVHGLLQARILEWVAFPFSRGSCPPRDGTRVSCIGGGFFTI